MSATAQDVLAHYGIPVAQQMGDELRCLCPFHDDHTPSLDMNAEKGLWVCRAGCGGGPLETFIMRMENVPLVMAKMLLEHDFVLYEGDLEEEFRRRHAEAQRGRDQDIELPTSDAAAKRRAVDAVLHYMVVQPELSAEVVARWIRVLTYVMSDHETYAQDTYRQLHIDFQTDVQEDTRWMPTNASN